jgi:chemotaxis protein methyltransferase CheR
VTIYFPQEVTQRVIDRLFMAQTDGGWLVVGHSEPSLITYRRYQVRNFPGAIIYQRCDQPGLPEMPLFPFDEPVMPAQQPPMLPVIRLAEPPKRMEPVIKPPVVEEQAMNPLKKARELLTSGHSEQARDLLTDYVSNYSNDPTALTLLGQAYANLGCWPDAEKCCGLAIKLDRLSRDAYYIMALVLQHQQKVGPATEAMKKVVYIDRKDVLGHFGLADLYHLQGILPQALKSLDNVYHLLENAPDNAIIQNSGGITAKHLREVVVHQQQQWSGEASVAAVSVVESEE